MRSSMIVARGEGPVRPTQRRRLFVIFWNEWAEGYDLEPDLEHGHGFLKVIAEEALP